MKKVAAESQRVQRKSLRPLRLCGFFCAGAFRAISRLANYHISILVFALLLYGATHAQTAATFLQRCDSIYASNPDSSFVLSRQAELSARESNDTLLLAKALAKNSRYLILKSRFEEASTAVNASIKFSEAIGDVRGAAYANKLKAILLKRIGNHDEAIALEEKAARLYDSVGDYTGKCNVLLNLSLDYIDRPDFEKAQAALDTIGRNLDRLDSSMHYYYYQNRGTLLSRKGDYEGALREYGQAKPIVLRLKMLDSYVTLLALIAEAQMKSGDLDAAEASLDESCKLARENHLDNELNEALVQLTDLYVRKGDYKKAFETQREQAQLNNKIYNLERINKINELEKRLLLAEKEKQLAEKESEQVRLRAQNVLLYFIIFAVIAVAVLSILLLVRTRLLNRRIAGQKKLIEEKSAIIEDAYTSITDSISYSKRIQNAILPTPELIHACFPESFVLYKPKDIVSGDFYWLVKSEAFGVGSSEKQYSGLPTTNSQLKTPDSELIFFAAVDCTGHGVPGAFMSIVGYNQLNEAVNVHGLSKPHLILNALNKGVSKALRQTDDDAVKDGMDIALGVFDPHTYRLQFAGAYNPLWIVRDKAVIELKGDKQPIGAYPGQELKPFTLQTFQLQPGDLLYVFSDGYADQFGGPKGKKFKSAQLQEVLIANAHRSMEEQRTVLDETIEAWRGGYEQIDDILVMGVRIT